MSEEKTVTCIMCPLGCKIRIKKTEESVEIKGAGCEHGKEYAMQEITAPARIIMSALPCKNSDIRTITVKTSQPVSKEKIRTVMKLLSTIEVTAPIHVGEIIVKNIGDLHIDIVATRNARKIS